VRNEPHQHSALVEALVWFIDNDETNRGDEPMPEHDGLSWDQINAYWVVGLMRGEQALSIAHRYLPLTPTAQEGD
jgi:hypothetical protein